MSAKSSNSSGTATSTAKPSPPKTLPSLWLMALSGTAASWGEFCTIPFDTAKVRLQIQDKTNPRYKGLFDVLSSMFREEGVRSPWKGVVAGIQRQMVFAPIRIGLYEPVRDFYTPAENRGAPTILQRIEAGVTTSAIGITVASPTDVVKVRLQAEGRLPAGTPRRYAGVLDAYSKIVKQEGIAGLWTGYGPNLARNVIVNATELVAYDQSKQFYLQVAKFPDDWRTHFAASLTAGLAATLLGSPVDVIKTTVMAAQKGGVQTFKGPLDCAWQLFKNQGPLAFYKGFIPNFARIGSWNIVTWMTLEQFKQYYWQSHK